MIVTLSDMLTRLKNGQRSKRLEVDLHPFTSKKTLKILEVMHKEGYIRGYKYKLTNKGSKPIVSVLLKYDATGCPVIRRLEFISSSKKRVYSSVKNLWKLNGGSGTFILSTPKGYITDKEARFLNVGGEIICSIY